MDWILCYSWKCELKSMQMFSKPLVFSYYLEGTRMMRGCTWLYASAIETAPLMSPAHQITTLTWSKNLELDHSVDFYYGRLQIAFQLKQSMGTSQNHRFRSNLMLECDWSFFRIPTHKVWKNWKRENKRCPSQQNEWNDDTENTNWGLEASKVTKYGSEKCFKVIMNNSKMWNDKYFVGTAKNKFWIHLAWVVFHLSRSRASIPT